MMMSNVLVGVTTNSALPISAAPKVTPPSSFGETPATGASSSRNAQALVAAPGSSAAFEVALAAVEGRPTAISDGKVAKVPPPASAFIVPPISPAPATSAIPPTVGSAKRGQFLFGQPIELGAALLLGSSLQLTAGGIDVAATRGARRRRD